MTCLKGFTIAFDLDGTLVDTAPDLARAMNHVLRAEGLGELSPETVRPLIGQGALALIARGFHEAGRTLGQADADQLKRDFLAYYNDNIAIESRPFEGVSDAIASLVDDGATLVVCTNKPQGLSERLLDALDMSAPFAAIVGADAVPARKPDPGHVLAAVARGGGDITRAVFVGDSETDERAARSCGLPFLLYPHGYRSATLEELAADAVFEDYRALPAIIRSLGA